MRQENSLLLHVSAASPSSAREPHRRCSERPCSMARGFTVYEYFPSQMSGEVQLPFGELAALFVLPGCRGDYTSSHVAEMFEDIIRVIRGRTRASDEGERRANLLDIRNPTTSVRILLQQQRSRPTPTRATLSWTSVVGRNMQAITRFTTMKERKSAWTQVSMMRDTWKCDDVDEMHFYTCVLKDDRSH